MKRIPAVYPITDRDISGLGHLEQVKHLAQGGAKIVQLRDKTAASGPFCRDAIEVARYASEAGILVIINDRVDIALAAGAGGLHLGQEDLPPSKARALLGDSAIIGLSTHSVEQAAAAILEPVDYIAIGPVFGTASKKDPDPAVGLEGVSKVREVAREITLVAIGGIDPGNAQSVLDAGADSVAVIGAILSDPNGIEAALRRFAV